MTNIATQFHLPESIGDTAQVPDIANMVDQSKADYDTLRSWLLNTKNIDKKAKASPINHMYKQAISWVDNIKSTRDFFVEKENQQNDHSR